MSLSKAKKQIKTRSQKKMLMLKVRHLTGAYIATIFNTLPVKIISSINEAIEVLVTTVAVTIGIHVKKHSRVTSLDKAASAVAIGSI